MGDAPRPDDMTPIQQAQAYAEGRSDDIAREIVAELLVSHLALQEAGEELPNNLIALVSDRNGIAHGADVLTTKAILVPFFARLTFARDAARSGQEVLKTSNRLLAEENDDLRQRAERAERELAIERSAHGGARADASHMKDQLDAVFARIAELEASREPGAEVVERLVDVYIRAEDATKRGESFVGNGIRAVLSHLAAMGWEAIPSHGDTIRAASEQWQDAASRCGFHAGAQWYGSRLSPVLGALRARVAELEAERSKVGLTLGNHGAKLQNRVTDALDIMSGRVPKCSVCGSRDACKLDCPRRR